MYSDGIWQKAMSFKVHLATALLPTAPTVGFPRLQLERRLQSIFQAASLSVSALSCALCTIQIDSNLSIEIDFDLLLSKASLLLRPRLVPSSLPDYHRCVCRQI